MRSLLAQQTYAKEKGRVGLRQCLDPPLLAAQYIEVEVAGFTYRVLKSEKAKIANYKLNLRKYPFNALPLTAESTTSRRRRRSGESVLKR